MSPNMVGALVMMASMACFTLNDTLIKLTGGAIPLFQLLVLRGGLTIVLIVLLARWLGKIHFRIAKPDRIWIALRCMAELGATYFFLSALFNMPLANVTAILQVLPLSVTLASALILRERVGWRRMGAVAVGFAGVMLIVKPGAEGFTVWSVYALMAVVFVTARDLVTRQFSAEVPSMTVTLLTAMTITGAAGLGLFLSRWATFDPSLAAPWVTLDTSQIALIGGSAVFILGGYFFSIQVMRIADVSFTAPFRYTGLVWALIIGWFVFGDWPGGWTLLGALIVVATGLFTLYRERRLAR